jgi:hypothetical protein
MKHAQRGLAAATFLLTAAALGLPTLIQNPVGAQPLFADLPTDFVQNLGQYGSAARFTACKGDLVVSFEQNAIKLHAMRQPSVSVGLTFEGASKCSRLVGEARRKTVYNFYVGNDPRKWRSHVAAYGCLLYRGLYKGVDVRIKEAHGRIEYDLILAPHADLSRVVLRADGASRIATERDGSLVLDTPAGPLRQAAPKTWEQLPGGKTRPLACRFRRIDARRYGFVAPGHDPAHPLVVDPGLEWGTYVGGSNGASVRTVVPVPTARAI